MTNTRRAPRPGLARSRRRNRACSPNAMVPTPSSRRSDNACPGCDDRRRADHLTGDAAEDAWELMRRHGFHHVVVTRGSSVVGVLSDRDAGGPAGSMIRRGHTVEELMTTHVVTVEPTTTVRKAANLMRGRSIGCVVVTDRGRVVGIVTVADLLEILGRGDRPAGDSRQAMDAQAPSAASETPRGHRRMVRRRSISTGERP